MNTDSKVQSDEKHTLIVLAAHDLHSVMLCIQGLNLLLTEKLRTHPDTEIKHLTSLITSQCEQGTDIIAGIMKRL